MLFANSINFEESVDDGAISCESVELAIDVNMSSTVCEDILTPTNCDDDQNFAYELNKRTEMSMAKCIHGSDPNLTPSIGNDIFEDGYEGSLEGLISMIDSFILPEKLKEIEAQVSALASDMKGLSPELLSKLWMVPENLAEDVVEINAHLSRRSTKKNDF